MISFLECGCNTEGSTSSQCNIYNGICSCKENIAGKHCDKCSHDYTIGTFPNCTCKYTRSYNSSSFAYMIIKSGLFINVVCKALK